MLPSLLAIGSGAAIGAWLRWGLGLWLNPHHATLPLGTLVANLVGGYGVGLALGWFAQAPGLSPEWRLFVMTGLLGGLTTFSSFSAETVQMLLRQQYAWAGTTVALHVLGSFSMTVLGLATLRALRAAAA
jgi:fluoride exporter